MAGTKRFPKEGFRILTLQLSPQEQESLDVLKRLLGARTKSATVRSAIQRMRYLLQEAERRNLQPALVDDKDHAVVVHFVM